MEGKIESIKINNNHLEIKGSSGESLTISYYCNIEIKNALVDSYSYKNIQSPDGSSKSLELLKERLLTAWIGVGVRAGMGPEGLKVMPGRDTGSVVIQSDRNSWIIPVNKEKTVSWKGGNWTVYASTISMGTLQDQPAFATDIVIVKQ